MKKNNRITNLIKKEISMKKNGFYIFLLFVFLSVSLFSSKNEAVSYKKLYKRGHIQLKEKIIISEESFPEGQYFSQIGDFDISEKNEIFVSDNGANDIKIFDKHGIFKKTIGQKGSGPGDLYWPDDLVCSKKNIYVWEIGNKRFSVFSQEGKFIKILNSAKKI